MPSPRYILVAEDDPDATFLLQHAFAQVAPDVRVVYTSHGKEAIAVLQGSHSTQPEHHQMPLLLLLDWKMPRMNGCEVLEWLQHSPHLRPDCIVVLGACLFPADMKRAQELGADYYVVKPIDIADLVDIVRALVAFCRTGQWPPPWAQRHPQVSPLRSR